MALILDGTNGLSDVDGSAATPAIRGSDANTGIFFPAADTIAFAEGGVESARFDASGNFLVGQTTPVTSGRGVTVNGSQQSFIVRNGVSDYNEIGVWAGASNDVKGQLVAVTPDNKVLVGSRTNHPLVFNINDTERARITTGGNLLVGGLPTTGSRIFSKKDGQGDWNNRTITLEDNTGGASQPGIGFHAAGNSTAAVFKMWGGSNNFECRNAGDNGFVGILASSFTVSSDYRIKTDVVEVQSALQGVLLLRPVNYIKEGVRGREHGFIAHEVSPHFPDIVRGEKDAMRGSNEIETQTLDYMGLTSVLVKAIQEQQAIITALTARVEALEGAQA